ncbi:MAG: hypothetical protein ACKO04_02910 [Actinomycetes bacterium]
MLQAPPPPPGTGTTGGLGPVDGPDVALPGSQQLLPVLFGLALVVCLVGVAVALVVRRRRGRRTGQKGRPTAPVGFAVAAAVAGVLAFANLPPRFFVPEFPPLPRLLPEQAFFYRPVTDLPVAPQSASWVASQQDLPLMAGFGGQTVGGSVDGVPFNPVGAATPRVQVNYTMFPQTSPKDPVPMADPAYIETMPRYAYDQHYVAVDLEAGTMWELINVRNWFGRWEAGAGAVWDLDSLTYPTGSTTASGLPLLPGSINFDEVAAGSVDHVVLFTSPVSRSLQHVWPARGTDGRDASPTAMPQGAWLRLKAGTDLSQLGPQARVVAEGLQRYGMVLSDTSGGNMALRGVPDARWDDTDLATLRMLSADDFEVVDTTGVKVADDSMDTAPAAG